MTTAHNVLGTLFAVAAAWTTIALFGPHDIAGALFGIIFTVVIVVTALILNVALKREPFISLTSG
jgi:hypothetical protein